MIRILVWGLLALLGAGLAMFAVSEQGYVAVNWSGWLVETSVSFLLLLITIAAALIYGVIRFFLAIWRLPERWRLWRAGKRAALPMKQVAQGLQALALQEDDKAMQALVAGKDASQWLRYLLAAQLAHAQHQLIQRDGFIDKALALAPDQAFTIRLLHSRWLMDEQPERALALIDSLQALYPKQRTLKAMRVQALERLSDWQSLAGYLPEAKNALSRARYLALQSTLLAQSLCRADNRELLEAEWKALTRSQQRQPQIAKAYVERALVWGASSSLWQVVVKALEHRWDAQLLPLLVALIGQDPYRELKQVQQWLKTYPNEPVLWWLSGLLAQQQGMTQQAEQDLLHSLQLAPNTQVAVALSDLYSEQSKPEAGRRLLCEQLQGASTTNRLHPLPQIQ
jgi:HemY protein